MVTIARVCQSQLSLMLLLDGLCNGAKQFLSNEKKKNHS